MISGVTDYLAPQEIRYPHTKYPRKYGIPIPNILAYLAPPETIIRQYCWMIIIITISKFIIIISGNIQEHSNNFPIISLCTMIAHPVLCVSWFKHHTSDWLITLMEPVPALDTVYAIFSLSSSGINYSLQSQYSLTFSFLMGLEALTISDGKGTSLPLSMHSIKCAHIWLWSYLHCKRKIAYHFLCIRIIINLPETLNIIAMAKLCGKRYGKKATITGFVLRLNFLDKNLDCCVRIMLGVILLLLSYLRFLDIGSSLIMKVLLQL